MTWNIELSPEAQKNLSKLGTAEARRILDFLYKSLRVMDSPRDTGKSLVGPTLSGLWRYRVGDYRILCRIEDENICIVVIVIGHRGDVYRSSRV